MGDTTNRLLTEGRSTLSSSKSYKGPESRNIKTIILDIQRITASEVWRNVGSNVEEMLQKNSNHVSKLNPRITSLKGRLISCANEIRFSATLLKRDWAVGLLQSQTDKPCPSYHLGAFYLYYTRTKKAKAAIYYRKKEQSFYLVKQQ